MAHINIRPMKDYWGLLGSMKLCFLASLGVDPHQL